jgi:hypothetical protein
VLSQQLNNNENLLRCALAALRKDAPFNNQFLGIFFGSPMLLGTGESQCMPTFWGMAQQANCATKANMHPQAAADF